jgi:retron-type reverse transcriptase
MSASSDFKTLFQQASLKEIYYNSVRFSGAPGIDGINSKKFETRINEQINIINYKVLNGTYHFSLYKEKLLIKSSDKKPRVISISTIRDKLTLKALSKILTNSFNDCGRSVHKIINDIASNISSNQYDGFLRLDIKDFYPSVSHHFLKSSLSSKIKKQEIINLLFDAVTQITVPKSKNHKLNARSPKGIPLGLPISNILANIYMIGIDKKYLKKNTIKYYRYVDDILILCKHNQIDRIKKSIDKDLKKIDLDAYSEKDEKYSSGKINSGIEYLGYTFTNNKISIRKRSIEKQRELIINALTHSHYSNNKDIALLEWTLNIRITGGILNNNKYGWLFFFSQTNDLQLLASLDHFIKKQLIRFGLDIKNIKIKTYLRSHNEITKNLKNTTYVPNFDLYGVSEKRTLLSRIFKINTNTLNDIEVDSIFNRKIFQTIKQLEKDIGRIS